MIDSAKSKNVLAKKFSEFEKQAWAIKPLPSCKNDQEFSDSKLEVNCLKTMTETVQSLDILNEFIKSDHTLIPKIEQEILQPKGETIDSYLVAKMKVAKDQLNYYFKNTQLTSEQSFKNYIKAKTSLDELLSSINSLRSDTANTFSLKLSPPTPAETKI